MTEIKSVNAPAIGQAGVDRLFALTRETKMTAQGGSFQAGYEQAKRDMRDALTREVGNQDQTPVISSGQAVRVTASERKARKSSITDQPWWKSRFQ